MPWPDSRPLALRTSRLNLKTTTVCSPRFVSIFYNTELVKAADLSQDFDDLLQPKWQNRIAMPDPSRHTSTA